MPRYRTDEIRERLCRFPKVDLINLPTPLRKLDGLSAVLEGPSIYIKRDDLTGLAFGGNKSRKLEYVMADALRKKADTIITWASVQSNWCMQTAAAARMLGLKPIIVLFKTDDLAPGYDGNLLLDYILEADIRVREAPKGTPVKSVQALEILRDMAAEVRARGFKPYVVPVGGSLVRGDMDQPFGALSYIEAFAEIQEQARAAGVRFSHIVHATGSGGTQAGLVAGAKAMAEECRIIGISVSDPKAPFSKDVREIAEAASRALDLGLSFDAEDIEVDDSLAADGYGVLTRKVANVIRFVFESVGIVLDPVYTAKAMTGLMDLVTQGRFRNDENVLFLHTGGTPALFPYRDRIVELLSTSPNLSDI